MVLVGWLGMTKRLLLVLDILRVLCAALAAAAAAASTLAAACALLVCNLKDLERLLLHLAGPRANLLCAELCVVEALLELGDLGPQLKEALNNTELSAEEIRTRAGEVQQQSLKVFEVAYKKRAGSSEGAGSSGSSSEGGAKDADFEDVKDKK